MKLNLRKIFNWDISKVSKPVPVYELNYDGNMGRIVIGYDVTVKYVYHGQDSYFFDMDSERLWALYGHPRKAAEDFYQSMYEKQAQQVIHRWATRHR